MSKRDFYEILGVSRESDDGTIKTAYRKLALKYHPDRNPNDKEAEERFKEATEAYEILKDPDKRRMYDQYGHAGVGQGTGGFGGFGGGFEGFDLSDALRAFMRDFGGGGGIFDDLFGGGQQRRRNRGEDLRMRMPLTLEEIAKGTEKKVRVKNLVECGACDGSGVAAGSSKKTCPQCKGQGQVRQITRTFLGTVQQVTVCPSCRGQGEIIADPCNVCKGEGRVRGDTEVTVKVPPGVASGNYLTMNGMGNAAPNHGEKGDLIVVFEEKPHDDFNRRGDDVIYELAVSFTTAALGGTVTVPTLFGEDELKIPSGTQPGKILKMRGKGIPHLHHPGKGDQLVQITVWVPTKLTNEEKKMVEQLGSNGAFEPPKQGKSFFEKLRETLRV